MGFIAGKARLLAFSCVLQCGQCQLLVGVTNVLLLPSGSGIRHLQVSKSCKN